MRQIEGIDIAILGAYLIGVIGLGLWVGRKSKTSEQFMAAGRRMPWWAAGLSIFGTYVSSITFLALPSKAFSGDWNVFVFSLAIPLAAWVAAKYFVPFYRSTGALSSYQHLEQRFGPWARTYAVACYLLTQLARMGTIMYLVALALAPLTGWSVPALILLTGVAVIIYTLVGGMEAVIWTDVIQSIVLIAGSICCVTILAFGVPGGPEQLFHIAVQHRKFSLGSLDFDLTRSTFWVVLMYGIFINLQNFGIDQSYVQRYHTAKTEAAAKRSVWLGALLYLPVSALFLFIGTGLFAFYTTKPELLPQTVAAKPDSVFPHFIATQLPVGLTGLVIAAVFAAAQSTISSSINCAATLLLCDIYKRYFKPDATERQAMRFLWTSSLIVGIAGVGIALAMMRVKTALDAWWALASIFSGGMLGLFLLGQLAKRANAGAAVGGVFVGVVTIAWMSLSRNLPDSLAPLRNPLHEYTIIVIGTLTILLVGAGLSLLSGHRSKDASTEDGWTIKSGSGA
ncbi:MAG: sodium:solute symporter [Verrucomicrobiae bacterium]|nr:sodium:solute symporter [Verrucomicrobiae bacterium]MDW7980475.1 sodium:solute symporter [Verrucomicrobiales bacterium]